MHNLLVIVNSHSKKEAVDNSLQRELNIINPFFVCSFSSWKKKYKWTEHREKKRNIKRYII